MTNLNLKLARTLIQVLAFGILLFQIQNSVRKYWEEPVYPQQSSTNFNAAQKLIFYVCQDNQFDFEKVRRFGYFWGTDYTIERFTASDHATWTGNEVTNLMI